MSPKGGEDELWVCPRCGAKLITRNLWHGCGPETVDDFLEGKGPKARALYERVIELLSRCGPVDVMPTKTRIAFMGKVRFASIGRIGKRGMDFGFSLPHPLESPRFWKVQEVAPGWWSHRMRITDPEELDEEVLGWLRESYRLMGMRERLRAKRS